MLVYASVAKKGGVLLHHRLRAACLTADTTLSRHGYTYDNGGLQQVLQQQQQRQQRALRLLSRYEAIVIILHTVIQQPHNSHSTTQVEQVRLQM
jgi:hypothetical protein